VLLSVAAGLPVPVAEISAGGSAASLVALVVAAAGVGIATIAVRLGTTSPDA
jgi:hypothetical protein